MTHAQKFVIASLTLEKLFKEIFVKQGKKLVCISFGGRGPVNHCQLFTLGTKRIFMHISHDIMKFFMKTENPSGSVDDAKYPYSKLIVDAVNV